MSQNPQPNRIADASFGGEVRITRRIAPIPLPREQAVAIKLLSRHLPSEVSNGFLVCCLTSVGVYGEQQPAALAARGLSGSEEAAAV